MRKKFNIIFVISILVFLCVISTRAANYLYEDNEISYDNTNSDLISTDVESVMSELYTKCNASSTTCGAGMTCTPKTNIKCQRAKTLHTEACTTSTCQGEGNVITYGNVIKTRNVLVTGDAFDCDVNGDGTYDAAEERFYYISDYFDTSSKKFNDKVAVLVYYSNTDDGVASTSNVAYYSSGENWHGPVVAIRELPTTTQWNNISLYKNTRQILTSDNTTSTRGGTLPTAFDYSGYSARLLTYQELHHGCYDYNLSITSTKGLSTNCNFLFEGTRYANLSVATRGGWLETSYESSDYSVYCWDGTSSSNSWCNVNTKDSHGVRPAIEVLKSEILY